jgi:hypothetical protein
MKYVIQNTIALVFILCFNQQICAQLLPNGDFESTLGCVTYPCGGMLDPSCCPNWHRSHGTANVITTGTESHCYLFYSNLSGIGEGIFYNYNFVQNKSYRVCFNVYTNYDICNTQAGPGIIVRAANGVPETNSNGTPLCGEAIPTPTNSQTILTDNTHYVTRTQVSGVFTADANYSQLWIYPFLNNCNGMGMNIDDVSVYVESCPSLVFNHNYQISAGVYDNRQIITAGSGSAGELVYTNPGAPSIQLLAENYVLLIPDFFSSPSSANYFLAMTQPCHGQVPNCPSSKTGSVDVDENNSLLNEQLPASLFFEITPNPFTNQSTITYRLNRTAPIEMQVFDINGKMVWQKLLTDKEKGEHSLQLNLTGFPAGVYFLNAIVDGKNYNKKLILTD